MIQFVANSVVLLGLLGTVNGMIRAFEGIAEGSRKTWTLSDYVGESARKKGVVVAWFPKAFTPG